jgi:hypothetical protein
MKATEDTLSFSPREQARALRARVCQLLRWTELQYGHFQYEQGLAYLQAYVNDAFYADQVSRSKVFWAWWRNHWMLRDMAFTEGLEQNRISIATMDELYAALHNGESLVRSIRLNRVALEESHLQMMHQVVKEEVCKS